MYAKTKRHKLVKVGWKAIKQVNVYTAAALPPAVAGGIASLAVYYVIEWEGGRKLPTEWSSYTPTSLINGLLIAFTLVIAAFVTYQGARKHPTLANGSTVAGIATMATLSWATQQCNWGGGIAAGITAAGTIILVAAVVRALKTGSINRIMTVLRPMEEHRKEWKGFYRLCKSV